MDISMIILAHTQSDAFNSNYSRYLHPLGGEPLIRYPWQLAVDLSTTPPWLLVSAATESPLQAWAEGRARCVHWGAALPTRETVLLLYGDAPLLPAATVRALLTNYDQRAAFASKLVSGEECVAYLLPATRFQELQAGGENLDASLAFQEATTVMLEDERAGLRIHTRVDLSRAEALLRQRINEQWMLAGVTLVDPATTYIAPTVIIGRDTVIWPHTHLRGQTTIGTESELGPNSILEDCTIGNHCRVTASVLEHAVMEDESNIGPFGHLRSGARLCRGAHMGNFGEMKKSTLGPGAKMGHFSYLGDTTVAAEANIGAGTITCNYDGAHKHPTEIGEGAFIGSGSMLVAPVKIGAGAKTGAGSVVTHDLPPGSLAYGVPARLKSKPEEEEA
ncbi:MAG: NTP transferase domain-containing protein [Chloroflexota bacterium]|nr:NTP transferase domain-containing protein [Chloroflexota bacterium]